MTIRHVIYTQEPGVDGTGITTIEKEQLLLDVEEAKHLAENVGTDTPGETTDQLRIAVGGPRWLPPDSVSPMLFDAAGDGETDDYAAIMQAYDALRDNGKGTINLGGRMYRSNTPIELAGGVSIDGGGNGSYMGYGIMFPAGSDGIKITGSNTPHLRNLVIRTDAPGSTIPAAGSGVGLTISSIGARIDAVFVHGFGGDGVQILGGSAYPGLVANAGLATQLKSMYNGGRGIYLHGDDANAWAFVSPNVTMNRGWGIYNDALYHNSFYTAHAFENLGGDYFDDGWGSYWANPYSEGNGKFQVGLNSLAGTAHFGSHGSPEVFNLGEANTRGWIITRDGVMLTRPRYKVGNFTYDFFGGAGDESSLDIRNATDSINHIRLRRANGAGAIGFFGSNGTTKPTVTGAKGGNAALTSLITALANFGLITDSTS